MLSAPLSWLRCAAARRPGSREGRITASPAEIGFSSVHAPPPKLSAWSGAMKLHVTAPFSPRAAIARRARRTLFWAGVAVGLATPSAPGERKSVGEGKRVSVEIDPGGGRKI